MQAFQTCSARAAHEAGTYLAKREEAWATARATETALSHASKSGCTLLGPNSNIHIAQTATGVEYWLQALVGQEP